MSETQCFQREDRRAKYEKKYGPVPLKMLPDRDGLLDEVVQVLGDRRSKALGLENTKNLVARDEADLGNTVGIPQDDA